MVMRSLHWKLSRPPTVDLAQFLHAGMQPVGETSMHLHCGGKDLVQMPHLSQHSVVPWLWARGRAAARTATTARAASSTCGLMLLVGGELVLCWD